MQTKVFTIRFSELKDCFDDTELREFIKDKEVLTLREHFFMRHEIPYLLVIVTYNLSTETPKLSEKKKERDESWRELLAPEDIPLFNALRDWRNETSRRQGIAPYIICTNQQLAEIVQKKVSSKNELSQIERFGKMKVENYGADIVALMTEKKSSANQSQKVESDGKQTETTA